MSLFWLILLVGTIGVMGVSRELKSLLKNEPYSCLWLFCLVLWFHGEDLMEKDISIYRTC